MSRSTILTSDRGLDPPARTRPRVLVPRPRSWPSPLRATTTSALAGPPRKPLAGGCFRCLEAAHGPAEVARQPPATRPSTRPGTNVTVANGNAKLPDFNGPFWGTFDFQDDGTLGGFTGTWSWGNSAYGRASGKSMDGLLLKVTLGLDPTPYPALPGECGVAEFLIIDPHG